MQKVEIPSCSICLSELSGTVVALGCGHCYHKDCIFNYLTYKPECPGCRTKVIDEKTIWNLFLFDKHNEVIREVNKNYDELEDDVKENVPKLKE